MTLIPDKYGHCVFCHRNMLIDAVIDGKVEKRFTPEYAESEYMLSDGSRMRVAICQQCKDHVTELDNDVIMECVVEGWREEVNGLKNWSIKKKEVYMERYGKKKIVCISEEVSDDVLKNKLKEKKWA